MLVPEAFEDDSECVQGPRIVRIPVQEAPGTVCVGRFPGNAVSKTLAFFREACHFITYHIARHHRLAGKDHSKQPSRSSKAPIAAPKSMNAGRTELQGMWSRRRGLHSLLCPCHDTAIWQTSNNHVVKEPAWRHSFRSVARGGYIGPAPSPHPLNPPSSCAQPLAEPFQTNIR